MEQHFQDVAQKSMNDNNLDSIADHLANYFTAMSKKYVFKNTFHGKSYWLNENLG